MSTPPPSTAVRWLLPVGIVIYFLLGLYPLAFDRNGEIFPFFSFRLYSRIKTDYTQLDVMQVDAEGHRTFALIDSRVKGHLRRKVFAYSLADAAKVIDDGGPAELPPILIEELVYQQPAYLVRITGDNLAAYRKRKFVVDTIASW